MVSSYRDVIVEYRDVREKLSNLPFDAMLTYNRSAWWELWRNEVGKESVVLADEFSDVPLKIYVGDILISAPSQRSPQIEGVL